MATSHEPKSRKKTECPVFGMPRDLSDTVLPTYGRVMKQYLLVRHQLRSTGHGKEPSVSEVSQQVVKKVESLWNKASIPILSHTRVLQMLRVYLDKYRKLLKCFKGRRNVNTYKDKLKCFRDDSKRRLFDIAACKCVLTECHCDPARKVPKDEQEFLTDQRTVRLMCIGSVDKLATINLINEQKGKAQRVEKYDKSSSGEEVVDANDDSVDDSESNLDRSTSNTDSHKND